MSYLPKLAPVAGNGLGGMPKRSSASPVRGEITFGLPGTYSWIVPAGVSSICAVCVGPGSKPANPGGGGGLGWKNGIAVKPKEILTVIVGAGGTVTAPTGANSEIKRDATTLVSGNAASGMTGGGFVGDGGGNGGTATVYGGAGAGGYSGNGGGGASTSGSGGGGGAGLELAAAGHGGGGVGLFGEGASGVNKGVGIGGGGSGGQDGFPGSAGNYTGCGGSYGGGAGNGTGQPQSAKAGDGAVRILWGAGRAFPSTDVGAS